LSINPGNQQAKALLEQTLLETSQKGFR